MELVHLIDSLTIPTAYPYPVEQVTVCQTHISVVFLAGSYAYKIKKPVNPGFLDFTTLEQRRHFCLEEVRLNRRLAPTVYLGVVPVTRTPTGVAVDGEGEVVEWAVKMERLPKESTLLERLRHGEVNVELMEGLAGRIASFHHGAEGGEHIAAFGRFEVVAGNARENFDQASEEVGVACSRAVFERLQALTESELTRLQSLIERRANQGIPRDTHGDLRLDHVYLFPERRAPNDLVVVDCIEFNERFRFADPIADMAFLVMDLRFHGRRELSQVFSDAYFRASKDEEGRALLSFYTAYRAAVRGKVNGLKSAENEIPDADRQQALTSARGSWLLALEALEAPGRKPCLVLVGGLPGTGKSTLARGLTQEAGFSLIRSDIVRKELAGLSGGTQAASAFGEGLYTRTWTDRTYAECLRRAEELLLEGERVVVDASFREEHRRRDFCALAEKYALKAMFLECRTSPEAVRSRLRDRRGDASDADWQVYCEAAKRWEEPGPLTRHVHHAIDSSTTEEESLARALALLREQSLADQIPAQSCG